MTEIEGAPVKGPRFVEAYVTSRCVPCNKLDEHRSPHECEDRAQWVDEPKRYEVAEKVGIAPLVKFAQLAKRGEDSMSMEALATMGDIILAVLTDESYAAYMDDAGTNRADSDDMFAFVSRAIEVISARPTSPRSDSTPGPATTTENLTESSSFADRKRALGLVPVMEGLQELAG